jgi:glycerol-3-phosphate dehydrogenase (NAD(P)+)
MRQGRIAVVGAGAWGTALANAAALAGNAVTLWSRNADAAARMQANRANAVSLPGVALHAGVVVTGRADELAGADAVLLVVPAQEVRGAIAAVPPLAPEVPLVICAKGIERASGRFLSEVAAEVRPGAAVAVLSGPSFAADVARGLPTAVALAAADGKVAEALAAALTGPTFRVYHGSDVRGVEIGGAAKNVLAIACGAVSGRGLGESARAALTARGFAELMRFAAAYGARPETLMGLSGLGDVVLSCASAQSRNFAFGERLGRGLPAHEAAAGKLVEGASTASVLVALARAKTIEMPIAEAVGAILAGRLGIDAAVEALMARPVKAEH